MAKQVVVMTLEQKDALLRSFTDMIAFVSNLSTLPLQEPGDTEAAEKKPKK